MIVSEKCEFRHGPNAPDKAQMKKNHLVLALLLLGYGSIASAQLAQPTATGVAAQGSEVRGEDYGYVGAMTRIGLGYDDTTHLRGEVYRVLSESPTRSILGEAWISRNAGGLKVSYNWLPEPWSTQSADPTVRKFFVAADRNAEGDAKVTVGGGFERAQVFGGLYGSFGVTGRRQVSDLTTTTVDTIQGNDGRPFLQDITTSVRTRIFERPYDYGIGARIGRFHEPTLIRGTLGIDYEWGRDSARQTTFSAGVEKYFAGAPYSVALNVEHFRKSGGFDLTGSDTRLMAMLRYDFGGAVFRPARESRSVRIEVKESVPAPASVAVAPPPLPPPAATTVASSSTAMIQPPPRKETRLVKTTASMSADAFFEFDKSVLTPAARSALDGIIARVKSSGFVGNLRVTGHTCDIGSAKYNQGLSERRAMSVREYLAANGGISRDVIVAEGQGERSPRYPNTRADRHKNRRVDLELVTYEDKVEEFLVQLPPVAAPAPASAPAMTPTPAPVAVTAPPVVTAPPAPVQWRREIIDNEPPWLRRALRQSLPHKQTVDVYRQRDQATTVTSGDKRYINRPPLAGNDSYTVAFNSAANSLDVLANDSDPDGDSLTIMTVSVPQRGTASISGSRIAYSPLTGFTGSDTFTYSISDGKGGSASATVTITVQGPPNRPPVAQNDTYSVDQGSSGNSLNVLSNDFDPDGDTLTITSAATPLHGTNSIAGNRIIYTPTPGYSGTDTFSYSIADGRGGTATATVTIAVQPPIVVNRPPVAQNDNYTLAQDSTANSLNVLANDSDPDGDTLTIATVSTPVHGSASIVGNRINYTPTAGYSGNDTFTYSVSDGKGGSATATVSITITPAAPANRPPIAQNDTYTIAQDSSANSLNVLANDSDPDGDALTIATTSTPAHGSASIAGNRINYMPAAGYSGPDTFTYTISDGKGGSATATVSITITPSAAANRPPQALNDAFTVDQDSSANSLNVLANDSDPDSDPLTITTVGTPGRGAATIVGNRINYTPAAGFVGTDTFTYSISDGRGGSATATVTITVRALVVNTNRPPVARDDAYFVFVKFTELDVLANDTDPDGDPLTIVSVTQPIIGRVEIISGGKSLRYTMPTSFNRTVFTYTISDGRGGTSTATVTLTDP